MQDFNFMTKLLEVRKINDRKKFPTKFSEVVLIVECDETKFEQVEEVLWMNLVLGVNNFSLYYEFPHS
ncbi:hypothetical protein BKP45_06055 [Anaerobacillus alkalidiazotrophicus]|uniref:Uncharacterized protein n=1 Tax=Anaerobacillus alkalidiazotrophicus TaxID=472963 RepID=A0A1S2MC37_9BACI|nr:hypothetical protein [Anaerobacillus alkalidiazotrophicus]OIJ22229.1 hypothetical protein BKP45_06055 [Anaerobacillus alkalidiazotrophicus]